MRNEDTVGQRLLGDSVPLQWILGLHLLINYLDLAKDAETHFLIGQHTQKTSTRLRTIF